MTSPPLGPVIRLAPAKINLTLAVVERRSDGFHALHSVFLPLALADRLSLAPLGGSLGQSDRLHVHGADTGPTADDLVLRGIACARATVGLGPGRPEAVALSARLEKRIPVAAGLAGGSSDGAAAFDGALELWGADIDADRRRQAAASIGSDVPFFLAGGAALVEGRGERVTRLRGVRGRPGVLLVTPAVAIRTPDVFAVFDGIDGGGDGAVRMTSEHLAAEFSSGLSVNDLVARTGVLAAANDLFTAAALVEPGLVALRRALTRTLGRAFGLSGSGPTLWTLYASLAEAKAAAETVRLAVADGTIPTIGVRPPTVIATTTQHDEEPRP